MAFMCLRSSSRRMSRGLERNKNREDVNKAQLPSDISPVSEDSNFQDEDGSGKLVNQKNEAELTQRKGNFNKEQLKPTATEKTVMPTPDVNETVSTRLERLKQWQQEKRRKAERNGEGKKRRFNNSPRIEYEESNLYRSTSTEQMKLTKLHAAHKGNANAAALSSKEAVKTVSIVRPVKCDQGQAIIHNSASNVGSVAARPAKSQDVKETPVKSHRPSTISKPPATQVTTPLRIRTSRRVKKCPKYYGRSNKDMWCMPCRHKKKCIKFT